MRCTGAKILLRIAQPDNGWRVEVDESVIARVNVSFQTGDEEAGVGARVTAVCVTGIPAFNVANRG